MKVTLVVFATIVAIETIILIPSYQRREQELLRHLDEVGRAVVRATLALAPPPQQSGEAEGGAWRLPEPPIRANGVLAGVAVYDAGGALIGSAGELPGLRPGEGGPTDRFDTGGGERYETAWPGLGPDGGLTVIGRLDASAVGAEMGRFVWRIAGLVAIIALTVTAVLMLFIGRDLIGPVLRLRRNLLAAGEDAANAAAYRLPIERADELGDVIRAFNGMLERIVASIRAAHRSERRLVDALESISEGFALYDADDRLVLCNGRYRALYPGVADVMAPGTRFEDVVRTVAARGVVAGVRDRADDWIALRLARHADPRGPHEQRQGDGRWVRISERRTSDGGTVAVYTDVTDLKRRQAELEEARDAAMLASRAKSEFLARMSHELRTPLNAIIGIAEMLLEDAEAAGGDDRARVESLRRVRRAGGHLLGLIDDVLDLSRIEAGQMELEFADVDLAPLLRDAATTAGPLAERNGNRLDVACPDDLGAVRADGMRVRQIVLNLLGNACKFTERGVVALGAGPAADD
ncbi:MAG TPA: PAS-domain containing protein, partial [Geminicoccaceae bacterium]|nr:PAS-domain containing protein [Geminicoccaceae bacterium]